MLKPDEPTYWKNRYATLLEELEHRKTQWQEMERLLIRVSTRVATSVTGLDEVADPHLLKIREVLRKESHNDEWREELDQTADALYQAVKANRQGQGHSKAQKNSPADHYGLLFSFLKSLIESTDELDAVNALQARTEAGEFVNEATVFEALKAQILSVLDTRPDASAGRADSKTSLLGRLFGGGKKAERKVDLALIQKSLVSLLQAVDMPRVAQTQANRLVERLGEELEEEGVLGLFQNVVEFLANLKTSAQSEQQSFEEFLAELTNKLAELEQAAVGIQGIHRTSEAGNAALHDTFSEHVENLKSSANSATELEPFRRLLKNRLELLSDYLSKERAAQNSRDQEAESQVARLSAQLQALESEAADLRTKLRVEHSLAMRDFLTGLPNRLAFDERIEQEISRWKRFHQPFSLVVWDIDHFKSINDRFGHKAGDKALTVIAEQLVNSIRETDFVARFGGEEFVMILSGTGREPALKVADKIRASVGNCAFNSQGKPVQITISAGVSEFVEGDSQEALFERTDQALYRAKNDGRNRCILV